MNRQTFDPDKPDGIKTVSGKTNKNPNEQDVSSFATIPLSSDHKNNDCTRSDRMMSDDDAAKMTNQSCTRQRSAIYSKRKYYKKKRYIEQLQSSKHQLEVCNNKLRDNNASLEALVQRAITAIAIKEQATAITMAQEQRKKQLQALLLLQQRHQYQAGATLSNSTAMELHQLSYLTTAPNHYPRIHDRIPSFHDNAVSSLLSAHHNHSHLTTSERHNFLTSLIRNLDPSTAPSSIAFGSNTLSSVLPTMSDIEHHYTRSMIRSSLLQSELEMAAALPVTTSNMNHSVTVPFLNLSRLEMAAALPVTASNVNHSIAAPFLNLPSWLDQHQQTIRLPQPDAAVATVANPAAVTARHFSIQNQNTLDQNALLQYYLSMTGRNP